MKAAELIDRAIERIETSGWWAGRGRPRDGESCLIMAFALGSHSDLHEFGRAIGAIELETGAHPSQWADWNDAQESVDDVLSALRRAKIRILAGDLDVATVLR